MSEGSAQRVVSALTAQGRTVAVAESLTGGAVCDALVQVPGASACLRGGVVAYASDVKARVLGVDAEALRAHGPVAADVAVQMAHGVRDLLGADLGVGTTGVAGPGPADGHPAGTVHVAATDGRRVVVRSTVGEGDARNGDAVGGPDRAAVRRAAVALALDALEELVSLTEPQVPEAPEGTDRGTGALDRT